MYKIFENAQKQKSSLREANSWFGSKSLRNI